MPVYEWCERELRIVAPAEAPPRVRAVSPDEYVRHMQRSDPQAFYDAVGGAMGLDTQVTAEADLHTALRRHIEAAGGGRYVMVPTRSASEFWRSRRIMGPLG